MLALAAKAVRSEKINKSKRLISLGCSLRESLKTWRLFSINSSTVLNLTEKVSNHPPIMPKEGLRNNQL